jgi:fructose-1,6-bisphosphatase/inositol monophosphatase family enzyme
VAEQRSARTADVEAEELARALAEVGRRVRDAVRSTRGPDDGEVLRTEGGDDVYGVDARAEIALNDGLQSLAERWPGTAIVEGHDEALKVGSGGPWTYLIDPVDGTRPLLAGKRSAWVLLGAGRDAHTLEDLEVGAMVEIPTDRAALGRVAWAAGGGEVHAVDDDLITGAEPETVVLTPRRGDAIDHGFVTVVRLLPGDHGPIGRWADEHLAGHLVWDDLVPCTGAYFAGLASGSDTAVFDPRPLFSQRTFPAHPYDLAGLVVARAAGVIIEALPPGPLDIALDTTSAVAWAGYANAQVATRLRPLGPIGGATPPP